MASSPRCAAQPGRIPHARRVAFSAKRVDDGPVVGHACLSARMRAVAISPRFAAPVWLRADMVERFLAVIPNLPIRDMEQRHIGLTKAIADSYVEAASVCLDRHHRPPKTFTIDADGSRSSANAVWEPPGSRTRSAWANTNDATEAGAYACVLAAAELAADLVAVGRAHTMTGADYYVAKRDESVDDLENCLRLEISGVDRGPESAISRRLAEKRKQVDSGRSNLPALAGVVGFEVRLISLAECHRDDAIER